MNIRVKYSHFIFILLSLDGLRPQHIVHPDIHNLFCSVARQNPNTYQSAVIIQTYKAQIWNHSMRVALRFCS